MRNISFSQTTEQVRKSFESVAAWHAHSMGHGPDVPILKDVTRRMGWLLLIAGAVLAACEKCQGLGKGGKIKRLGRIRVASVRRERLDLMIADPVYGAEEARREGFPGWTGAQFVEFFCAGHKGCTTDSIVTRIEFEYLYP